MSDEPMLDIPTEVWVELFWVYRAYKEGGCSLETLLEAFYYAGFDEGYQSALRDYNTL